MRAGPFGCHILAEFTVPPAPPLCYATVIFCYVPPLLRQKSKVPHELPFCGVVAGPLGDWLRVWIGSNQQGSCKYIGPFPSLLDEWGGLEGAFRSTVPRSEGLGR